MKQNFAVSFLGIVTVWAIGAVAIGVALRILLELILFGWRLF